MNIFMYAYKDIWVYKCTYWRILMKKKLLLSYIHQVYTYICIYIHMHVCTYAQFMNIFMYVYKDIWVYKCTYWRNLMKWKLLLLYIHQVCAHIYLYIYIYTYTLYEIYYRDVIWLCYICIWNIYKYTNTYMNKHW
jgi:hypothetical protein